MSLSSVLIRESIAELLDEAQAISNLAETEKRDVTDDENVRVDAILDQVGDEKNDETQKPTGLRANLARAEKLEAEREKLRQQRLAVVRQGMPSDGPEPGTISPTDTVDDTRPRAQSVIIPAKARRHGNLKAYTGSDGDKEAYIAGQFILATVFKHEPSAKWCQDHGVESGYRAAMSGGDNTLGGFLVPDEMERAIINLREEYGVFRREARVVPMGSDVKTHPRRTAGAAAYYLGEGKEITASTPTFDNVKLVAKKLAALILWSSEIGEDEVIGLGDFLTDEIAQEFAFEEDKAGFIGDGTNTYGGISGLLTAVTSGSRVTAATANTAFSTLDLVDFEEMIGALPHYADRGNAKWYISRAGWAASMMRLADAAGGVTAAEIEGKRQMMFLGYPVVFTQAMNSTLTAQTSTNGLAYFGDLRQTAMFGDRRGISIAVSTDRYFELDQIAIRGTQRYDIAVHEVGVASGAAGSIIQLSTPSS